ncbi:MAG: hypothetical protein IIA62_09990 [Nitrospinae bacterium]|nr:hypothetical protein [Nitrospinota bacterium]
MFYEVRVLDGNGELKKVISPKRLSARFWKLQGNGSPETAPKSGTEESGSDLEPKWDKRIARGETPVLELDESFE